MEYEYRIKDIIKITGVTKRTLHYYDEMGLLSPKKMKIITESIRNVI
ncbi:MerR family DNA-binding transcriptional regulator [Staphylococcus coagulans]